MGYHIRPGLVEENVDLLVIAKQVAETGAEVRLHVEPEDLGREQYRFRRILAASDVLRAEAGGEFAGLGARVGVATDMAASQLVIKPRRAPKRSSLHGQGAISRLTEFDVVSHLSNYRGAYIEHTFWPSSGFDLERFRDSLRTTFGWEMEDVEELPGGRMKAAFSRLEQEVEEKSRRSAFDLINRPSDEEAADLLDKLTDL